MYLDLYYSAVAANEILKICLDILTTNCASVSSLLALFRVIAQLVVMSKMSLCECELITYYNNVTGVRAVCEGS